MTIIKWLSQARILAWLLRLAGLIAIFSVPFKHLPGPVENWLPFDPDSISHFAAVLLGIALLYIAGQLARQKYTAFLLAAASLGLLTGFELLHHRNPGQLVIYALVLALVIYGRHQYVVKTDYASTRRVLLMTLGTLFTVMLLASVAFLVIDQREFGVHISSNQSFRVTIDALTGKPIPANLQAEREGLFLVDLLRVLFYVALAAILYGIFRPISLRNKSSSGALAEARCITQMYSVSSEDFFKLWPPENKHYFFYKDSFVVYGVKKGVAIILDGCTGNPKDFSGLRKTFQNEARLNGWDLAILHADKAETKAWEKRGAEKLYIGSEARVDISAFQSITTNKHFRYIRNKAAKEAMHVEFWQSGLSKGKIATLKTISDAWLANDRREYQFAMGYFDEAYLASCECAVLYKDNEPVAYINFIPTYFAGHLSIDHMRFVGGLSNVAMHFLFLETLKSLHEQGAKTLNLGLAPLSKLEENADSTPERLLSVIKRLGGRYYSFSGLEQFKGKFEPSWEPTYLVYFGPIAKLVPIGLALNSLMAVKTKNPAPHKNVLLALVVIAAIGYASWPLAIIVNPAHAFNGLVSLLSSNAQPYDWLFNWLDYVSSAITMSLFGYIFIGYRKQLPKALSLATLLLAISGTASLLAAIVDLPDSFTPTTHITLAMIKDPVLVTHGIASFVNTATYTAAIIAWFIAFGHTFKSWRGILVTSMALLVTVGFVIGQLFMTAGYAIQRIQILLYAVWLVWFAIDVFHRIHPKTK
jgi:phosphatidylglycerol lysyltransferase